MGEELCGAPLDRTRQKQSPRSTGAIRRPSVLAEGQIEELAYEEPRISANGQQLPAFEIAHLARLRPPSAVMVWSFARTANASSIRWCRSQKWGAPCAPKVVRMAKQKKKRGPGVCGEWRPSFHRSDPRKFPSVCGINLAKKFLCSEVDHQFAVGKLTYALRVSLQSMCLSAT
jgi:hypothetical protein